LNLYGTGGGSWYAEKPMKKPRRKKMPIRLDAKPTKPHSTPKGARGYSREKAKTQIRKELERADGMRHA